MSACRSIILVSVSLMLLAGTTTAQVPEPAIPAQQPTTPATQPPIPPGIPGLGTPAAPPALPDPVGPMPGMPSGLPNLQGPPPGGIGGLAMPPSQPRTGPSNNALLRLFDIDGDGILSGDEVEAAPARLWELDRNMNAELSADELGLIMAPRWQERRRGIRGYVPIEPAPVTPTPIAPSVPEPALPALPGTTPVDERAKFEVYPLRGLDPGQTLAVLQQLLQGQPQARLTFDGRSQSILALAPPSLHAQIRKTLADLLEGERRGIPGLGPAMEDPAAPGMPLPVVPRSVPLYNAHSREILKIVQQVYRDRIVEPGARTPSNAPGRGLPPGLDEPSVPAGKMVIGEGMQPNTIVISADDKLFFEVLDLIERLDEGQGTPADDTEVPPEN